MALTRESFHLSVDALPEPLDRTKVRKVPTGIADLDSIVDGGFPSGSTILLWGDIGAGMQEYIYTAASKTAFGHDRPEARHYYLGDHCDASELPNQVCYVTFSRSKEIILQELATSFNGDYYRAFRDHTVFKDFSSTYFRPSVVDGAGRCFRRTFGEHPRGTRHLLGRKRPRLHGRHRLDHGSGDLGHRRDEGPRDHDQGSSAGRQKVAWARLPPPHARNPRKEARGPPHG